MTSSRLATMYTPRTVAAACLYDTLRELNFHIKDFQDWCSDIGKVDDRDVDGEDRSYGSDIRGNRGFANSDATRSRAGYNIITTN